MLTQQHRDRRNNKYRQQTETHRQQVTTNHTSKKHKQYRVIHKSVKHFKNSQQINYSTDHGSSYTDRERNSPSFFFTYFTGAQYGNTADIYAIVHLVPHACQHITVDQSHSSGDTVEKIWGLAGEEAQRQCPSQTDRRKSRTGLNPGTGVANALMRHLFSCASYPPLWQVSIEIPSHVFVVSRRAVLLKGVIITVFIQLWHQPVL